MVTSVRDNDEQRALLKAASEQTQTSPGDFIRRKSLEGAEIDVLERRVVTIPAKDWEAFEAWAHRPPQKIPVLENLVRVALKARQASARRPP